MKNQGPQIWWICSGSDSNLNARLKDWAANCHSSVKDPEQTKKIRILPNQETDPQHGLEPIIYTFLQYAIVKIKLSPIVASRTPMNREPPKLAVIFPRTSNFAVWWSPKMRLRRFAAVRGKDENADIGSLETCHPNMSTSQTSYHDLLRNQFKLESEYCNSKIRRI
jgi:hypothetical protein